jgi:hypothetical protein
MGGGDLNMKKSWHPLVQKNQERVWQEENRAREERKRIEQKRKEIAEEKQLQDLQKLQESQGGKARVQRLDWMYAAPGSGGQGTSESMEAYLLGKKTVEELLKGDDNDKLKKGSDIGFIATQNANSVVDTRNKVLNDPLLAIKKQEQRQFEALMNNPIRLKQMKLELEGRNGKVKDSDGEKRHRHHKSHRDSERRHRDRSRDRERHRRVKEEDTTSRNGEDGHKSEKRRHDRDGNGYRPSKSRRYDDDHPRQTSVKRDDDYGRRHRTPPYSVSSRYRSRSPPVKHKGRSPSPKSDDAARKAALDAMRANAEELESSRAVRLASLAEREKAEQEREDLARLRKKEVGGRAGFMRDMPGRILDEGMRTAVK